MINFVNSIYAENDFSSVSDTGTLRKRNSEFYQQESNLWPSNYYTVVQMLYHWNVMVYVKPGE